VSEKIAIASDHRGIAVKAAIIRRLEQLGADVLDMGPETDAPVDYPEYACKVAVAVSRGACDRGVLICGSGIGMSIVANKFRGVRAALCHDVRTATMCRLHNNANILVMGESVGEALAREMAAIWFETAFEGGRHQKRLDLIAVIEADLSRQSSAQA
jgi:ribose 5-phosphate isomerase B